MLVPRFEKGGKRKNKSFVLTRIPERPFTWNPLFHSTRKPLILHKMKLILNFLNMDSKSNGPLWIKIFHMDRLDIPPFRRPFFSTTWPYSSYSELRLTPIFLISWDSTPKVTHFLPCERLQKLQWITIDIDKGLKRLNFLIFHRPGVMGTVVPCTMYTGLVPLYYGLWFVYPDLPSIVLPDSYTGVKTSVALVSWSPKDRSRRLSLHVSFRSPVGWTQTYVS